MHHKEELKIHEAMEIIINLKTNTINEPGPSLATAGRR
jgi:hypothetical protein